MIRDIVESEAEEIWSGEFAREFAEEKLSGMIMMNRLKEVLGSSDLVKVEKRLLEALKRGKLD
jgi:ketol-acid reductoisomerase